LVPHALAPARPRISSLVRWRRFALIAAFAMSAPKEILDLVARFEHQLAAYKSGHYHETQLRREFLDPFWKALGWDVDNTAGYAEAYKDVVHEDTLHVRGVLKAPDYSFRIGGARKFLLEAKKPSVFIKEEIPPAFQLRCYGWNVKLALSVLSDFEEFAVYDCRFEPHKDDPADTARVFYCTFREYADQWDWIAARFSREAVLKGDFDRFAESIKAKRGTREVDEAFLETIEGWRLELARNLALHNPKLTRRELNFAVQHIIDRIVFLRICEDRGIEDFGRLQALAKGDRIYPRLCQLFEAADVRFNSGLFHFKPEPGRHEPPDGLTLGLQVDDKLLRDIFGVLYYPDSSYDFSLIPTDILGQAYEQFLGKVIRLTPGHRAVVEEKPEVKKAGGVYYTPTYIVDYIVRQTVGTLLDDLTAGETKSRDRQRTFDEEGKGGKGEEEHNPAATSLSSAPFPLFPSAATPRAASRLLDRVSPLRILDPACGSGSFLLGAYQYLLDWHLQFYLANDPARWAKGGKPALVQTAQGWKLTIAERKRILLNNIFGVDLDSQAVEVTKLSLLLKVLEGETQQTIEPLLRLFHERALPDLGGNIKCGNSLIGPDFYEQEQLPLLSDQERYRINVFDWQAEFPHILRPKTSGSELRDAPPAVPLDYTWPGVPLHGSYSYKKKKVEEFAPSPGPLEPAWEGGFDAVIGNPPYVRIQGFPRVQIAYFSRRYASTTGNFDLYVPFVERGLGLLRDGGKLGMIVPNKFFRTDYGAGLRRTLSANRAVCQIVDFGASQAFRATTYTCLLFLRRGGAAAYDVATVAAGPASLERATSTSRPAHELTELPWTFEDEVTTQLLAKLARDSVRLLDLPAEMSRGSSTGNDEVFVIAARGAAVETDALRIPVFASDFGRYRFTPAGRWRVIFPYHQREHEFQLVAERELRRMWPRVFAYLSEHQAALKRRKQFKEWFGYSAPRNLELHERAQIAVPLLADKGLCALIPPGLRGRLCPMASGGFTITLGAEAKVRPEYLLGLLNSKLLFWRLRKVSNVFRGGWITCTKQYFGELPIRTIDFSKQTDEARHDRLVSLVERMLALHRQLAAVRTPHEKTALQRQIDATDAQIDRLIYDLYGLTEDEIRIVEGEPPPGGAAEAAGPTARQRFSPAGNRPDSEAAAGPF
jgi:hypothetical protein